MKGLYTENIVSIILRTGRDGILPGKNPTSCFFLMNGGLIVTEAERGELLWIYNKTTGLK